MLNCWETAREKLYTLKYVEYLLNQILFNKILMKYMYYVTY